jgi:hypothetical protein
MTKWKITLLATLWLLLPAQTIPPNVQTQWDWNPPLNAKPYLFPMAFQERMLPPKEFDHKYDGDLTIRYLIPDDVRRECAAGMKPGQGPPLACARSYQGPPKTCTIWMMTGAELNKRGWDYDIVLRHELGHCAGWHHDY